MFAKLFAKPEPEEKAFRRALEPRQVTRFPHIHRRIEDLAEAQEPDTLLLEAIWLVPLEKSAPAINPQEQLHSDAPIPLYLFRRTLPERFREMEAEMCVP
ncbi:hypothetical protein ACEWPL_002280 [Roseovarius sp. S1116L3]|uniref:hypothetical protein n=1 Tax=Roseovarius roseus TaxID=3342636 RepID=UPI0037296E3C